jgi:predicted nucleic acid-binding protein
LILLDTNVLSEPLRPRPQPAVFDWLDRQDPATLYLSSITVAELFAGVHTLPAGRRRSAIERELTGRVLPLFAGRILPFDDAAAQVFGRVYASCRAAGQPLDFADGAMASIALARGFAIATRNVADFVATGVDLLNPWEGE